MLARIQRYFRWQKMKASIQSATEMVYAGQFDFGVIVNGLSKGAYGKDLLPIYKAVELATEKFELNFNDYLIGTILEDVDEAFELFSKDPELALNLHQARAEKSLIEASIEFEISKMAYEANPYSYDGIIYSAKKAKKGPLSIKERNAFKELAEKLSRVENENEQG